MRLKGAFPPIGVSEGRRMAIKATGQSQGALDLSPLIDRVEEARTVAGLPPLVIEEDLPQEELLARICLRLADDLESNSRRIIQTSVQLLGLRETAASAVALSSPEAITAHIASYLKKAFGFEQVLLLGADNEDGALRGTWIPTGEAEPVSVRVPFSKHDSVVTSVFYSDTPSLVDDPSKFPLFGSASFPGDHVAGRISSYVLVPLVGGRGATAAWGTLDEGPPADRARAVGVLGVATAPGSQSLGPSDLSHLESIAPGVAGALETALLTMDLRRNERFTASILNSMNSGLVAVDLEGRIVVFNKMAERLTGMPALEAVGTPVDEALPEVGGTSHLLVTLREGSEFVRKETSIRLRNGEELPVSLATFLVIDADSRPMGAVATFVDLTELRKMEEKVRQLDRLATLGKFASAVAHEIRNPLAGIAAGVQYIGKNIGEGDPQLENLEFVLAEINRLNRIISDLFSITHPQQPLLQRQKLEPVVERGVRTLEEIARSSGVTVETEFEEGLPEVEIDPDQMEQVLINLVKNGIEAAGTGGHVKIEVRRGRGKFAGESPDDEPCVAVSVRDSGPGVEARDETRIFEPFFSTKEGGTGLGLYVSKGIVERHGGIITVETSRGGSNFTVMLPVEARAEEDSRK